MLTGATEPAAESAADDPPQKLARLLLTLEEAAELLSVSHWSLRRWIRDGDLVPTRIGKLVRISPDELEAFVRRHTGRRSRAAIRRQPRGR